MAEYLKVGTVDEIPPGKAKRVDIQGRIIALFNVDGPLYAVDDECSHRGGSLSEGEFHGREVSCLLHGASFDVTTGAVLGPPADRDIATYPVRVRGEDVEVAVGNGS
jgi:nitrite reductase/ring-hydroxylating ferredoxin subunit